MKFKLAFLVATFCVSSLFCCFVAADEETSLAIAAAEDRIVDCYNAVAEADRAGANVTALLVVLEESGWLLSRARLAYSVEDFGSAVDFADQSREMLEGFVAEADLLREGALQQGYWDFMVNFVGSTVGALAVVFGGFAVWVLLKRRYKEDVV